LPVLLQRPLVLLLQLLLRLLFHGDHQLSVFQLRPHLLDPLLPLAESYGELLLFVPPLHLQQFVGRGLFLHLLHHLIVEIVLLPQCRVLLPQKIIVRLCRQMLLRQFREFLLKGSQFEGAKLKVVVKFLVLYRQLPMHTVDLIDLVLKLETQRHFLIKCLFGLFIILHQNVLIVFKVSILIPQQLQLLENLGIPLLVDVLVIIDDLLAPLDLLLQHVHLPILVALYLPDHRVEITVRTVLQKNRVHLPKSFSEVHVARTDLPQEGVEAHRIHKKRFVDTVQIERVDPLGKERILVDAVFF